MRVSSTFHHVSFSYSSIILVFLFCLPHFSACKIFSLFCHLDLVVSIRDIDRVFEFWINDFEPHVSSRLSLWWIQQSHWWQKFGKRERILRFSHCGIPFEPISGWFSQWVLCWRRPKFIETTIRWRVTQRQIKIYLYKERPFNFPLALHLSNNGITQKNRIGKQYWKQIGNSSIRRINFYMKAMMGFGKIGKSMIFTLHRNHLITEAWPQAASFVRQVKICRQFTEGKGRVVGENFFLSSTLS